MRGILQTKNLFPKIKNFTNEELIEWLKGMSEESEEVMEWMDRLKYELKKV